MNENDRLVGQLEAKIDLVLRRMDGVDATHDKLSARLRRVEANQQRLLAVVAFCGFLLPLAVTVVTSGLLHKASPSGGLQDILNVLCAERGYDQDDAACQVLKGYRP